MAPDGNDSPVPTLSVVLTGRNDGCGGDFLARAITAIRFNDAALTDSGVDYELVLVEWAPLADRALLADLIEPGSFRITRAQYADRAEAAPWGNQRWHSRYVSYENPDSWGLGNAPQLTLAPRRVRLLFEWKAVPPMLDLKRLVIPARHAFRLPRRTSDDPT